MSSQSSLSKPLAFARVQNPRLVNRLDAESEYSDSKQEPWEVADDLDDPEDIGSPKEQLPDFYNDDDDEFQFPDPVLIADWERFEEQIANLSWELDGLMPEE